VDVTGGEEMAPPSYDQILVEQNSHAQPDNRAGSLGKNYSTQLIGEY
jgi:hypothetical protein